MVAHMKHLLRTTWNNEAIIVEFINHIMFDFNDRFRKILDIYQQLND